MTTIAYREGTMAADSLMDVAGWRMPYKVKKIRRTDKLLIGIAGNPYLMVALVEHLANGAKAPDFSDDSAALVVDIQTGVVRKYAYTSMIELEGPFFATGSGSPVALAAMHAGATAEEAVKIAALLDPGTGGDIQVERIEGLAGVPRESVQRFPTDEQPKKFMDNGEYRAWLKQVIGVLFDAMPPGRTDIARGTKTLLFDDGSGLTISSKGTFWVEHPEEVKRAIAEAHGNLCRNQRDLKDVLDAAGVLLPAPTDGSRVS